MVGLIKLIKTTYQAEYVKLLQLTWQVWYQML